MAVFYVDSSAAVMRYKTEIGSDVVDALYDGLRPRDLIGPIRGDPRDLLVTSHLSLLEMEAVAARALKGRVFDDAAYNTFLSSFAHDLDKFSIVPVSTYIVVSATRHTKTYALRPPDAIHFATAVETALLLESEIVVLVASDKELLTACAAEGFNVLDPEAENAMEKLRHYRGESEPPR